MSFQYQAPANIGAIDFKDENSKQKWSDNVYTNFMRVSLDGKEENSPMGTKWTVQHKQFYTEQDSKKASIPLKITWNAFPNSITTKYNDVMKALEEADNMITVKPSVSVRQQDEYCEWFVHKDDKGKIVAIDFTAEPPEYYEFLFENEPQALVNLYRQYVNPNVQLADLTNADGKYNSSNKWNTTEGAMHLNCPPNSLFAEVYLAASATVLRKDSDNNLVTDAQKLIKCAEYGRAQRNSDPKIGSDVNGLARAKKTVTLENPVGLYIDSFDSNGIQRPDGNPLQPIERYVKLLRGHDDKGLRYRVEVPNDGLDKFVLGDCTTAEGPIVYGGQVAKLFTIHLVGLAADDNEEGTPVSCEHAQLPAPHSLGLSAMKTTEHNEATAHAKKYPKITRK